MKRSQFTSPWLAVGCVAMFAACSRMSSSPVTGTGPGPGPAALAHKANECPAEGMYVKESGEASNAAFMQIEKTETGVTVSSPDENSQSRQTFSVNGRSYATDIVSVQGFCSRGTISFSVSDVSTGRESLRGQMSFTEGGRVMNVSQSDMRETPPKVTTAKYVRQTQAATSTQGDAAPDVITGGAGGDTPVQGDTQP